MSKPLAKYVRQEGIDVRPRHNKRGEKVDYRKRCKAVGKGDECWLVSNHDGNHEGWNGEVWRRDKVSA